MTAEMARRTVEMQKATCSISLRYDDDGGGVDDDSGKGGGHDDRSDVDDDDDDDDDYDVDDDDDVRKTSRLPVASTIKPAIGGPEYKFN